MLTPDAISLLPFSLTARVPLLLCLEAGCGFCAQAEVDSVSRVLRSFSGVAASRGIL